MQRSLSFDDQQKLDELNKTVREAIVARTAWLDSKMSEYAEMQIGDSIYDLEAGERVGKVTKLYRDWQNTHGGVDDRVLSVNYEFETSPNCFDNTSHQPYKLGSRTQAEARARIRLERLASEFGR